MHSKNQDSARNTESTEIEDYFERETYFIGDSMTSESIDALGVEVKALKQELAGVNQRLDHFIGHDRAFPTEGCEFCGVPSAA